MKKLLTFFLAGVALAALGTACNAPGSNDNPEATGVSPALVSDIPEELSVFLEERLMPSLSEFFAKIGPKEELCLTINSVQELKEVVPTLGELPSIDFEKYTIVIGQYMIPQGGYFLKNQSIDTNPDVMKLNLVFEDTGRGLTMVFYPVYGSLYPKLPSKPIEFNCSFLP